MHHLKDFCGLCLTHNEEVVYVEIEDLKVQGELETLLPEDLIHKTRMPKYICKDCSESLKTIYKFRQKCMENILIINAYVQTITEKYGSSNCVSVELSDVLSFKSQIFYKIRRNRQTETEELKTVKKNLEEVGKKVDENNQKGMQAGDLILMKREIAEKLIIQEDLDLTNQSGEKKGFNCDICNKEFKYKTHLKYHRRHHKGEKPYECDMCNKLFAQKGHLRSHKRSHTKDKSFKCDVCEQTFKFYSNLIMHKYTHNNKKPFVCLICYKTFATAANRDKHRKIHPVNYRPYKCDVCQKRFTFPHFLVKHKNMHESDRICNLCGRRFATVSHYEKHMILHSANKLFPCEVCGKTYTTRRFLYVHKRIHNGDKPYVCIYCGKGFTQSSNLIAHERSHTGERPFSCNYCKKKFNQRSNLNAHLRRHCENPKLTQNKA